MSYTNTLAERTCRYDMDDIDFQWLTSVNQDREDFGNLFIVLVSFRIDRVLNTFKPYYFIFSL